VATLEENSPIDYQDCLSELRLRVSIIRIVSGERSIVLGLVKGLFSLSMSSLSKRSSLFTLMNIVYFGSLFATALMTGQQNRLLNEWMVGESSGEDNNVVIMFVDIFLFNLVVSGFLLLTVTGLLLFPLPVGMLVFRASL